MVRADQTRIPAAFVRGGSSKAVFFHEHDIPPAGPVRDRVLKRVMGTPDHLQIDGMGGTKAVTSKIAIISPSSRPDTDIDYTFAQVGVSDNAISYSANCGNISSGVGPFAIEENLIKNFREGRKLKSFKGRTQEVRIYNTGTKKSLVSHVPIGEDGFPIAAGEYEIAAVPGSGAPILMDYSDTVGATRANGLLPSGNVVDVCEIQGKKVEFTICDVANCCIFANAADFGITGHESAVALTDNEELIALTKELRGKAAQILGMCKDWDKVDEQSPFMPMPVLVAPPRTNDDHISGRLFLDNMCHESMAGTGAVCFTACAHVQGSVVNKLLHPSVLEEHIFRIAHPVGMIPVVVEVNKASLGTAGPEFENLSFIRTSRRIMDGHVYVPKSVYDPSANAETTVASEPKTNGVLTNGALVNGDKTHVQADTNGESATLSIRKDIPVTKILAEFVTSVKSSVLTQQLREKLKEVIIDYIGNVVGGSVNAPSSESIFKGALALGAKSDNGRCTVMTKGRGYTAPYAGLLNATFGHSMDFDDTYAPGSLHPGVTAIAAVFAQAETMSDSVDVDRMLTAIAVGYEITCRLGTALGVEAYSRGFHNTSTCGIFGAVSAIAVMKKLSADTIEMAFGLAGSKAAGSMQYLDNGSWNKRLHAGFAVHDAFVCTALAEAGVLGATKPIEGKFGFLQGYSPKSDKDLVALTSNLGTQWKCMETALKPFPACRMTHTFIEMAGAMGRAAGNTKEVKSMQLYLPHANYPVVGERTENKLHPKNIVDAQFSAFYQTANAWLYGANSGLKTYDRLSQPEIDGFCDKIQIAPREFDDRAIFASIIDVEYEDGSHDSRRMDYPLGEVEHPFTRDQVDLKFFSLMEPVYGKPKATKIRDLVDNIERASVIELLNLLK